MSEAIVPIADIEVGERFRKDMGDLHALAASIDRVGLLHAVVAAVGPTGRLRLVAGERRLRACRALGWERIPVRVLPRIDDLLAAEHDENEVREPFRPSEAAAIAAALMPAAKAAARERMEAGTPSADFSKGRAADDVARAVGMSRPTLAKATEVVEAAAGDPTLQPLVEHMDGTGKVEPAHRALRRLPHAPTPEDVRAALASRDAAYDANFPGWREEEAARAAGIAWLDTWAAIRRAIAKSPPSVVGVLEREDLDDLPHQLADTRAWLDAVEAALRDAQRPRLVGGAS